MKEVRGALQKLPTSRAQQSSRPALKEPQAPSGPPQPAQPAHGSAHMPAPRRTSAPADRATSPSTVLSTQLAKVRLGAGPSPRDTAEKMPNSVAVAQEMAGVYHKRASVHDSAKDDQSNRSTETGAEQQRDKRTLERVGQTEAVGTGASPAKVAKVTDETVMGPPTSTLAGSDEHPGDSGEIALS